MPTYVVCTRDLIAIGQATNETAGKKLMRADVLKFGDRGPYVYGDYSYSASIEMARAAIKNIGTVIPRTDTGVVDPRYPTGVPPIGAPDITITAIPNLDLTSGGTLSMNFSSLYASGAGLSGATHSIVAVSGSSLATMGMSFAGTTLSAATLAVGQGTFQYKISKSGFDFLSNVFQSTVSAVAALTPMAPKFVVVTPDNATPKVTVTGDYGNGDIEIWRSVDGGTAIKVHDIALPGAQPALVFSSNTIGGATAASFSKSGNDLTIANVVNGSFANSTDATNFHSASVTLPVGASIHCTLPVFTSVSPYSESGIGIRQSLATLSPALQIIRRPDALSHVAPLLSRASQGATLTYTADATINGEQDARLVKLAANQWRYDVYNAGAISNIATHTVSTTDPVNLIAFANRVEVGAGISVTVKNVGVNTQGSFTWNDVSTPSGHTYTYTLRTKIGATFSAFTTGVGATISPTAGNAIKFNPGIYDQYTPPANASGISGYRCDLPEHYGAINAHFDRIKNNPNILGIMVNCYWRAIEGATPGSYSAGFAAIDAMLAKAVSVGKRLMLRVETGVFGGYPGLNVLYPDYIVNDQTTYGTTLLISLQNGVVKGVTSCNWKPQVMARINAWNAAYGARYNGHPNFELSCPIGETSISVQNGVQGFSPEAYSAAIVGAMPSWRVAWPNTVIRIGANDMGVDANLIAIYNKAVQLGGFAIGGPDVWPGDVDQSLRIFKGINGGHDYSSELDWSIEAQYQSFMGRWAIAQLWGAMVNGYTGADDGQAVGSPKCRRLIMYVNEATGTAAQKYDTGEVPFYASVAGRVYQESGITPAPTATYSGGAIRGVLG